MISGEGFHPEKKYRKLYGCRICDRKFTRPCHVTQHERTHTGEKPYRCSICNKSFTRNYSLKSHQMTHNKEAMNAVYQKLDPTVRELFGQVPTIDAEQSGCFVDNPDDG